MRTLPNLEILHPADGAETRQMLWYAAGHGRPVYLRLCRQPQAEVHGPDYCFDFGQPDMVHHGSDLVVFTMGGMVAVLVDTLPALAQRGIRPTIVNVSSLPVNVETVTRLAQAHRQAFVIEDHADIGGIADEIGRIVLSMQRPPQFRSWGVPDYGQAGSPEDLYAHYQLDQAGVAALIGAFVADRW